MRVEVEGDQGAIRNLGIYADHLDDFSDLWPDVTEAFTRREEIWFDRQGEGWATLDPGYAAQKARKHPGRPILVATGSLKDSLTDQSRAEVFHDDKQLLLGSLVPYAKFHATGTKKMPKRPPLIPVARLAAAVGRLLHAWTSYPRGRGV